MKCRRVSPNENSRDASKAHLWDLIFIAELAIERIFEKLRRSGGDVLKHRYTDTSIHHFIVDFYCPNLKLVIEVDGDSHSSADAQAYDRD